MRESFLHRRIEKRKATGTFRVLPKAHEGLIDFLSNDYLGLSRNEDLQHKVATAWDDLTTKGLGSTGSRLLSGNSELAEELEEMLAATFRGETALLFNAGYNANVGVLSSIPERGDVILYDELSHACIKDGVRLSIADAFPFKHNDLNHLEEKIKRLSKGGKVFIVTESLFSMDGDFAPIRALSELSLLYGAYLIVDEAHSTGVYGPAGAGWLVENECEDVFARIYTFGKAIGNHGACVVGSKALKAELINTCRPFIYTTALPPHNLISLSETFKFLKDNHDALFKILNERIEHYNRQMKEAGIVTQFNSISAIQPVAVPGNQALQQLSMALRESGFDILGIRSPTVKEGMERLRICLHVYNTEEEINSLADHLQHYLSS